jgi:CRISPR-associated endoribonuclease Cas6
MRLKILLESQKPTLIPWDYRTTLTRAIYEILAVSDPNYSQWLHDEGFRRGSKVYRLFVYSDFQPSHYKAEKDGLYVSQWLTWQVASPDNRLIDNFEDGLKKKDQVLQLFQNTFNIVDILRLELPSFSDSLIFHTLSPIVVATGDKQKSRHAIYLSPHQPEFTQALERNLIAKWEAFHKETWNGREFGVRVWNPDKRLLRVFDINVRAWNLKVQIWGSEELIRFAYYAGLGEKNSQGFGMVEVGG